ncbi:MAG: NAD(P)-dependent oxidoreductase [Pseudomonadota bacterium]
MKTIAFIGTGAIGSRMAANLIKGGFKLRAWNRNAAKAQALAPLGATVCATPAEAAQGADAVVTIVADDAATEAVTLGTDGTLSGAAPGTLFIDSTTATPGMARKLASACRERGCEFLDAPVSGSLVQAEGRELVFMVGGEEAAFARGEPVMKAMGRMARLAGPSGAGATVKLVNNMLSGTLTAAIAEAAAITEAAGVDRAVVQEILNEGAASSRLLKNKLPKIFERNFTPQFQLELMEKDLRYFLSLAQELDRPAPIASLVRSQYQAARRAAFGKLDACAVFLQATGEKPPHEGKP